MMPDPPAANPAADQPGIVPLTEHASVRESAVTFTFARSSGPGGQSVNKVNSRAQLRVQIDAIEGLSEQARQRLERLAGQRLTSAGELLISSDRHRSQGDNRRDCWARLVELVAEAERVPKPRKRTRPSRAMVERRLDAKRRTSDKKQSRGWRPGD